MGFFQKVGNALMRVMYGRNGMDQLGMASLWIGLALEIAASLLQTRIPVLSSALFLLFWVLWAWMLFRMFSKNLYKRREENSRWLSLWWRVRSCGAGARARHADRDHKYFTCKKCRTICRVPVGKGNIVITCPKCGAEIHAKT